MYSKAVDRQVNEFITFQWIVFLDGEEVSRGSEDTYWLAHDEADRSIEKMTKCTIFGIDLADGFLLKVSKEILMKTVIDIMENSSGYCKYENGSEDAMYKFTKFLWVTMPNGEEIRLSDIYRKINTTTFASSEA